MGTWTPPSGPIGSIAIASIARAAWVSHPNCPAHACPEPRTVQLSLSMPPRPDDSSQYSSLSVFCLTACRPWRYLYNSWNVFDFCIVFLCWLALTPVLGSGGSSVAVLRLLRLMRPVTTGPLSSDPHHPILRGLPSACSEARTPHQECGGRFPREGVGPQCAHRARSARCSKVGAARWYAACLAFRRRRLRACVCVATRSTYS